MSADKSGEVKLFRNGNGSTYGFPRVGGFRLKNSGGVRPKTNRAALQSRPSPPQSAAAKKGSIVFYSQVEGSVQGKPRRVELVTKGADNVNRIDVSCPLGKALLKGKAGEEVEALSGKYFIHSIVNPVVKIPLAAPLGA